MTNPSPFTTSPVEVVYNTPLTIINIFVECLRERFTAGNSSPALSKWAWTNDDSTTKIFIESGCSRETTRDLGRHISKRLRQRLSRAI
jgi:hypothetical protein